MNENFNSMLADALKKLKKQTNADRVRNMSDDELAEFLHEVTILGAIATDPDKIMNWYEWVKRKHHRIFVDYQKEEVEHD